MCFLQTMQALRYSFLTPSWFRWLVIAVILGHVCAELEDTKLLVVALATNASDGYGRFMKSVEHFGLDVKVLGMRKEWQRGDLRGYPSGSQKINMLIRDLAQYKDDHNLVVMVTDCDEVIFLAEKEIILSNFKNFNSGLVFAAERYCVPDESLVGSYPKVILGKPFLSSGGYIGYAPVLYEALTSVPVRDDESDQLFFTNLYLHNKGFMKKHNVKLDHRSHLFQNLYGAEDEVELKVEGSQSWIDNIVYDTKPVMIRGNETSRLKLNYLGNYIPNRWTPDRGCLGCDDDMFTLKGKPVSEYPEVLLAIFSIAPSPFFRRFLERVGELNYPKSRISLRLYVLNKYHHVDALLWLEEPSNAAYKNISIISHNSQLTESEARDDGINSCVANDCVYYFAIDTSVMLVNQDSLQLLVEQNRTFLAPLVIRHGKLFSNFWGALSPQGFYARSDDYLDIVHGNKVGIWNVPYVSSVYLIKGSVLRRSTPSYTVPKMDSDMAFCASLRKQHVFMYVTNRHYFGRLLDDSTFTTNRLHNDMYQMMENRAEWEEQYLHPNYYQSVDTSIPLQTPCPDVFYFPLISSKFARDLVEEMERYGQWSPSTENEDVPISQDSESAPTLHIALEQVGLNSQWLEIIKSYVLPVQRRVYPGYSSRGRTKRNLVVKYKKQQQFKPHPLHEKVAFAVSVGLSQPGDDYQGGGYRFIRYNCSVEDALIGHALVYPGLITHWHERLALTRGTRFVLISVIEP